MNAIARKAGRSKDVIQRFLKYPVAYNVNKRLSQKKKSFSQSPFQRNSHHSSKFHGKFKIKS